VQGTGFATNTKLITKMKTSQAVFISPTEMDFTLTETTTLDSQPITAQNADGSTATFYSYLRGVPVSVPTRSMLQKAEPIFQLLTHGIATVGPLPALADGQFTALAVQNPSQGPVSVTFFHQRTAQVATVILPSGGRIMDELGALFGGLTIQAGDVVTVNATSGVQILGITGDESANTLTPWLPQF
jgi:hypothetical protein